MFWVYLCLLAGLSLGGGLLAAGKRKKDKEPSRRGGVIACVLLLVFSFCVFLSPIAEFAVWIGAWMRSVAAQENGTFRIVALVAIVLVGFAMLFTLGGVARDIWRDGKPDRPTFSACMMSWLIVALFFGILGGSAEYDRFQRKVQIATVAESKRL